MKTAGSKTDKRGLETMVTDLGMGDEADRFYNAGEFLRRLLFAEAD